jgi:hypothetical protein
MEIIFNNKILITFRLYLNEKDKWQQSVIPCLRHHYSLQLKVRMAEANIIFQHMQRKRLL